MGAVDLVAAVLCVATIAVLILVWRRVRLIRRGGVDVAVRSSRGRWVVGVGHYRGELFHWHRVWSLRNSPDLVLRRGQLVIVDRRESALQAHGLPDRTVILRCDGVGCAGRDGVELAMEPDVMTGFLSWLESAPPGRMLPYAS